LNSVKIGMQKKKTKRVAYHHGDLRQHLINAAQAIIRERGLEGFTLREAARRAGVSPAAPAHHFKDARGLLTEVALLGFRDFGIAMERADEAGGEDPAARLREQGLAYVRFALEHPARFQLMFRHVKLDMTNPEFAKAARHSYEILERAIRAITGTAPEQKLSGTDYGLLLAHWSMVHGFSHLALGGDLPEISGERGKEFIMKRMLPLMLDNLPGQR
jgi:AcrR family transcriptional regulator